MSDRTIDDVLADVRKRMEWRQDYEPRDIEARPYSEDEQRVVAWLVEHTEMGGGDDPIGFMLASAAYQAAEIDTLRAALAEATRGPVWRPTAQAPKTEGRRIKVRITTDWEWRDRIPVDAKYVEVLAGWDNLDNGERYYSLPEGEFIVLEEGK